MLENRNMSADQGYKKARTKLDTLVIEHWNGKTWEQWLHRWNGTQYVKESLIQILPTSKWGKR